MRSLLYKNNKGNGRDMKSSLKNKILVFGIVIILVASYVVIIAKRYDNKENEQLKKDYISVESYHGRDVEEIKAHFEQFPDSYDKIVKYAVPVNTIATTTNKNMINDFCQKYNKGESCSLDMITFGIEGGMIYHYLQYNEQNIFYYCFGDGINDIEETYQHLYLFNIPEGYFDSFEASNLSEPFQELVLSTDKLPDYAEYEKLSSKIENADEAERKNSNLKIEGFRISPFSTEKELKDFKDELKIGDVVSVEKLGGIDENNNYVHVLEDDEMLMPGKKYLFMVTSAKYEYMACGPYSTIDLNKIQDYELVENLEQLKNCEVME